MHSPLVPDRAPAELPPGAAGSNVTPHISAGYAESSRSATPLPFRRVFLKTPGHTCCVGTDLPGIGHTHAQDCPAMARREQMPETLADFISDPPCRRAPDQIAVEVRELIAEIDSAMAAPDARRDRRETLIAELLFAARDLAEGNLFLQPPGCAECLMSEHLGQLRHSRNCRTGRVLRVLAELTAAPDFHPKRKEDSPDLETGSPQRLRLVAGDPEEGCAGDGIRPRGLADLVCLKCGTRGGPDWSETRVGEIDLSLLGMNQVAKAGISGLAIFTHDCAKSIAASNGGAQ